MSIYEVRKIIKYEISIGHRYFQCSVITCSGGSLAISTRLSWHSCCLSWSLLLSHKFIVVYSVSWIALFIEDAEALQQLLTLNFSFNEDLYLTKWLSLISNLVYYIEQIIHVATLFDRGEHLVFTCCFVYLSYILYAKHFMQEPRIALSSQV